MYKEEGIASAIFPNSATIVEEETAAPATSCPEGKEASKDNKVDKPSNSPALAVTPSQILVSFLAATLAATCATKKSAKDLGNVLKAEYPCSTDNQSEAKSFLHNCKLTWNSSGCKIFSVKVIVDVASKSQVAFFKMPSVATLLITCLKRTFGFTSIPPRSMVGEESKEAAMILFAYSPA